MSASAKSRGRGAEAVQILDEVDRRILKELLRSPRLPVIEIARRVGVARATVQIRIDRLTTVAFGSGGGHAPAAMGYRVSAFVSLNVRQGRGADVAARLASLPYVVELHTIAGAADLLCRVVALSNDHLQVLIDKVTSDPDVARATTTVVLSTPKHHRLVELVATDLAS